MAYGRHVTGEDWVNQFYCLKRMLFSFPSSPMYAKRKNKGKEVSYRSVT